jgi:TatD DNase family protein
MQLIDIGANLGHDSFDADRDAVLQRARDAGVACALAQQHPGFLYATAGVHPHHASEYTDECDSELRALHAHAEVVAVGECGLDYFRDLSPRPAQRRAFERQLQISVDLAVNGLAVNSVVKPHAPKPLFLHQRRAEMFDYLDQDWHIGITGWLCDERRGQHLRELVKHIPANRLMVETDAPYLLPRTVRPQPSHRRNEPMYLAHIVEELARERGEDVTVTAAGTALTARSFFRLPAP